MEEVSDNPDRQRFELELDGATAFASYRLNGSNIIFDHTIVPDALSGRDA